MNIQPPYGRQGNKYNFRKDLIPLFPPHDVYVELFAGSAALFFNKERADKNILNDLDAFTYQNLKLLQSPPSADEIADFPPLTTLEDTKTFYDNTFHKPLTTKTEDAVLRKIITTTGFRNVPIPYNRSDKIFRSINMNRWLKKLPPFKDILKGVKITNKDYEKIVKQYDSPTTFFFIDPPYENTDKRFNYAESVIFDFERLRRVVDTIKGKFLMTINDSNRIRELFKEFNMKEYSVDDTMKHRKGDPPKRAELIITNY